MKILLFLSALLFNSYNLKEEIYLFYSPIIGVIPTCEGNNIKQELNISTNSQLPINLYDFKFDSSFFEVYLDGNKLHPKDSLYIFAKKPLKLTFEFKYYKDKTPTNFLSFMSSHDSSEINEIRLDFNRYFIDNKQIREGVEQIIELDNNCVDKVRVLFPYGGTISSVSLFKESSNRKKPNKFISYGFGDSGENEIEFTKKDTGRYFVRFSSCHWGNDFWLTVK